jgi:hypothetical protein
MPSCGRRVFEYPLSSRKNMGQDNHWLSHAPGISSHARRVSASLDSEAVMPGIAVRQTALA